MKKIFIVLIALVFYSTLFLTNNIFAEIKVPGSGGINYWNDFEKFYQKQLKKSQKKKQKLIIEKGIKFKSIAIEKVDILRNLII